MELPTFFLLSFCFGRRVLCVQSGAGRVLDTAIVGVGGGTGAARAIGPAAGGKGLHCLASCQGAWVRAWDDVSRETGKKEGCGVRLEHQEGQGKDFDVRRDLLPVWCGGLGVLLRQGGGIWRAFRRAIALGEGQSNNYSRSALHA